MSRIQPEAGCANHKDQSSACLHRGIGKEPAEKDCRAHPGSDPKPASIVNQQLEEATRAAKEGHAPMLLLSTSSTHSQAQQVAT